MYLINCWKYCHSKISIDDTVFVPNLLGHFVFSRPFCNLAINIFVFIALVSDFLFSFMEMKANTVYARAQVAILRPSGHLGKDIAKLLKKTERWVNKWSKRQSFEDKPRSGWLSVLTNCATNVIQKAKYKRNNSTRKIAKNFNVTISMFWTQRFGGILPTKGGNLSSERRYHF